MNMNNIRISEKPARSSYAPCRSAFSGSPINRILQPQPEPVELADQLCRQQRDSVGADQERNHNHDDPFLVLSRIITARPRTTSSALTMPKMVPDA